MIAPLSLPDPDSATDEEIVAAYIAEGETEADARALLRALRGPTPPGAIID